MTICIGRPIIEHLANHGSWVSESGEAVVAASDLFGKNPYSEIEQLSSDPWRTILEFLPDSGAVLADYENGDPPEVWDAAQLRRCLFEKPLPLSMRYIAEQASQVKAWANIPKRHAGKADKMRTPSAAGM